MSLALGVINHLLRPSNGGYDRERQKQGSTGEARDAESPE
jgi:hypothetical protein